LQPEVKEENRKKGPENTHKANAFLISGQNDKNAYQWILMEINAYYIYVFTASLFLLYIQIRGSCGKTIRKHKSERYK
jgi:hypothetical protein